MPLWQISESVSNVAMMFAIPFQATSMDTAKRPVLCCCGPPSRHRDQLLED